MATDPREQVVRRLFALQRLSNTLGDQAESVIREMFGEIVGELAKLDPTAVLPRYRQGRLDKLAQRVKEIAGPAYDRLYREQRDALARIGADQALRGTADLRAVLGAGNAGKVAPTVGLGPNFFKAVIDTEPVQGALLKDWFRDQAAKVQFRVGREIRLGMTNGETIDQMVRRVRGRSNGRGGFTGGVMGTTTREAQAIVRTAVNEISNAATKNTQLANADILTGYTIVATLDGRTSDICIAYAQTPEKVYDIETGPRPPFHINCRTTTAPEVDWRGLGLEPPPEGTRASAGGQVDADTTYEAWLRSAPAEVQNDVLGPARAKLFRERRVTLNEMIKSDGRRVPLSELATA